MQKSNQVLVLLLIMTPARACQPGLLLTDQEWAAIRDLRPRRACPRFKVGKCLSGLTAAIAASQTTISSLSAEVSRLRTDFANANGVHQASSTGVGQADESALGVNIGRVLNSNTPADAPGHQTELPGRRPSFSMEEFIIRNLQNPNCMDNGMRDRHRSEFLEDYIGPSLQDRMAQGPGFIADDGYGSPLRWTTFVHSSWPR